MKDFQIVFHPIGKRVTSTRPITILEAAVKIGLDLAGPCGGNGKCGKCQVKIVKFPRNVYIPPDSISKRLLTKSEQKKGWRLACTTIVDDNIGVELPSWAFEKANMINKAYPILTDGYTDPQIEKHFPLEPVVLPLGLSIMNGIEKTSNIGNSPG